MIESLNGKAKWVIGGSIGVPIALALLGGAAQIVDLSQRFATKRDVQEVKAEVVVVRAEQERRSEAVYGTTATLRAVLEGQRDLKEEQRRLADKVDALADLVRASRPSVTVGRPPRLEGGPR